MSGSGLRLFSPPLVTIAPVSPFLLALVIAQATVYVWTDKEGAEHFTDELTSIPRGVKVRTTEGAPISRIEADTAKNVRPAVVAPPTGPAIPSASEQAWRQLFREAKTKVRVLEEDIEADRTKVEEVNGLPLTRQFNCATGFYYPQPVIVGGSTTVVIGGQPAPGFNVGASVVVQRPPAVYASPCFYGLNPEFERIRDRLDHNRRELVRAREELADLERRASFEAVPLEWRR